MFESLSQIPTTLDGDFLKKPVRRCVAEFGYILFGFLTLIAIYRLYYYSQLYVAAYLLGSGALVLVLAKFIPISIFFLWRLWMMVALLLSRVMTPLILGLMWVVAVIPTAVALKVAGIMIVDMRFRDESAPTYFKTRDPKSNDFELLKRQF
jgi:hypothetical protein